MLYDRLVTTALESAANAVMITACDGTIQWVNPAFCRLTGLAKEQVIGNNPRVMQSGQYSKAFYQDFWQRILSGQVWQGEMVNQRNGERYLEEMTITPVRDQEGNISNFIAIKQDITQRKLTEREIVDARNKVVLAERLASLETMAAGIAHEINQPLNSLKVTADGMLYWYNKGVVSSLENIMISLQKISDQAGRIDNIIKQMRSFVQSGRLSQVVACDINRAVHGALDLAGRQISAHGIRLEKMLQEPLPPILADCNRLQEVIINLLTNAMQSLDTSDYPDKLIVCETRVNRDGNQVSLSISDNGPGIDESIVDKIFDPFFTTKAAGEGMGIGLSIAYSIVTSFSGQISALPYQCCQGTGRSSGKGVTFHLEFPVMQEEYVIKPQGNI